MNEFLSVAEVAAMIGVTPHTLAVWRMKGVYGLPYTRIGGRIRYTSAAVKRWLEQRTNITGNK
ncbi:MAG: helix-turn-helix domain-containing protein [Muribaculaceae bacterium]|nr:helix-turn-helix domain-containing protein [Muribaculaceae bacterium]